MTSENSPVYLSVALCLLLLSGCSHSAENEQQQLEVSKKEISSFNGKQELHIDDLPDNVLVEDDIQFGATEYFIGASPSPDAAWLAVTTAGAAHSAGWLIEMATKKTVPAAFQYGGSVTVGPWSGDGRFASFFAEGPAPFQTLTVVDVSTLDSTVSQNATQVRLAEHESEIPPETTYLPVRWEEQVLLFEVDGTRYWYDPATGTIHANND